MIITLIILLVPLVLACAACIAWVRAARKLKVERERAFKAEATLEAERAAYAANVTALHTTKQDLHDTFASLSSAALQANNDQFLQLANERMERQHQHIQHNLDALVTPLRASLERQAQQVQTLEDQRRQDYGNIDGLLRRMTEDQQRLHSETANLVKALRQPSVRGRWGELQLRRVVELAGMSEQCDFAEQQTVNDGEGGRHRPDMQVRLPNQRQIVIDAKVPLEAYLAALESPDDVQRVEHLSTHARQVRRHVDTMSQRDYQRKLDGCHDFVVLFIPGEVFYSAALEHDHELLEYAFGKNVIIATPTTLIALLKAVALGWREARLSEEARSVKEEGEKLYKALSTVTAYINEIGKCLEKSMTAYNKAVGSVEARLFPSSRRMCELQVSDEPIVEPKLLEGSIRAFTKPELMQDFDDNVTSIANQMQ